MKLNSTIQWESILLDRISMEFRQQRNLIEHYAMEVGRFREFSTRGIPFSEKDTFTSNALSAIENRVQRLKEQVEQVKLSFSDFLSVQNMWATYKLQWYVLVLSVVATLATVVGIATGWPVIKQFLKDAFGVSFG